LFFVGDRLVVLHQPVSELCKILFQTNLVAFCKLFAEINQIISVFCNFCRNRANLPQFSATFCRNQPNLSCFLQLFAKLKQIFAFSETFFANSNKSLYEAVKFATVLCKNPANLPRYLPGVDVFSQILQKFLEIASYLGNGASESETVDFRKRKSKKRNLISPILTSLVSTKIFKFALWAEIACSGARFGFRLLTP
jgi:hypothetical protein